MAASIEITPPSGSITARETVCRIDVDGADANRPPNLTGGEFRYYLIATKSGSDSLKSHEFNVNGGKHQWNNLIFEEAGSWTVTLRAGEGTQVFIPERVANGYQTLEDGTELWYLMSASYQPEAAAGIRYDDARLAIEVELFPAPLLAECDLRRHAAGGRLEEFTHRLAVGAGDVPTVDGVTQRRFMHRIGTAPQRGGVEDAGDGTHVGARVAATHLAAPLDQHHPELAVAVQAGPHQRLVARLEHLQG